MSGDDKKPPERAPAAEEAKKDARAIAPGTSGSSPPRVRASDPYFRPPSGTFAFRAPMSLPPPRTVSTQSMPAVRAALERGVSQAPPRITIRDDASDDAAVHRTGSSSPPASLHPESLAPPSMRPPPETPKSRRALLFVTAAAGVALAGVAFVAGQRVGERRSVLPPPPAAQVFQDSLDVAHFQRGNVHAHTLRSDGHQSPHDVAAWYADHGYQFLVISDHDVFVDPAELSDVERPGFVLVPGEEISSKADTKPVHLQALCIGQRIPSGQFDDARTAIADAVQAIRGQHGVAVVNHPNFMWALGITDLASVTGDYGLEIWSGNPDAVPAGDGLHPAAETQWDELLARGRRVTGYAVDDMHTLVGPEAANMHGMPGRAWVETFGDETSNAAICDALAKGRLFASSGLRLRRIAVEGQKLTVWVDDARTIVEFIGDGGTVLSRMDAGAAPVDGDLRAVTYALRGGESYVRARATLVDVGTAWTQAYRAAR